MRTGRITTETLQHDALKFCKTVAGLKVSQESLRRLPDIDLTWR